MKERYLPLNGISGTGNDWPENILPKVAISSILLKLSGVLERPKDERPKEETVTIGWPLLELCEWWGCELPITLVKLRVLCLQSEPFISKPLFVRVEPLWKSWLLPEIAELLLDEPFDSPFELDILGVLDEDGNSEPLTDVLLWRPPI